MADSNIESQAARLEDATLDIVTRAATVAEMRDNIESWSQTSHFAPFLSRLVPVWLKILDGQPSFTSNSPTQRLRHCILEIFQRLNACPSQEPLAPHAVRIVEKLMALIPEENEDNAILCVKVIMDLQRHHTKILSGWIQKFLDLIMRIFENVDNVVHDTFASPAQAQSNGVASTAAASQTSQSPRPASPATAPPDTTSDHQQARPLLKGMQSFKVLAECPIAVVSIFQVYRDIVQDNVKMFVPLIKGVLLAQAPAQAKAHQEAQAKGTIQLGLTKEVKNRTAFGELVTAQVKTMSFLAYILRVFGQQLSDFLPKLPDIVVRLLRDCPKEKCAVRRELLVAIRHVINFNFRKVFLRVIEDLLDERTLLGDGLAVVEALKPIAYSTLADLIHHVRADLTIDQIRTAMRVYKQNMLSNIPGTSFQTMSAKLLMNMSDSIAKLEDKKEARYFLISILDATGDKFAQMNRQYENTVKLAKQQGDAGPDLTQADFIADKDHKPDWDQVDIFSTSPIKTNNPRERGTDPLYDNKFLFRNLISGLKVVFYALRACNPPALVDPSIAPVNWPEIACGFGPEEVQILIKLFHEGTRMFQYFDSEKPPRESHLSPVEILASHHPPCGREEKELLESFATYFHHIDPATFHEVFQSEIPHIYEMMFDHPALMQVPQFLLASEATSPSFAGMLLQFLMTRIEDVGSADVDKATILLRLFKLSFMAVTLFSQVNESVLLPHVNKLVTQSIKLSTTAETPMHYFYLLRSLFRSIGGGRFEHLYHEILPLLEMLLEVLNNLIAAARNDHEADLYVELSLTVPARLSNLLPHLSYLMKPLVLALRAGSELVSQGLRTLELCVDNLTADYLDPIMAPVIDDLMNALWEHLQPVPYNHFHSHTTMRILGKLGGRNRKFLEGPPKLQYKPYSDKPCSLDIRLIGAPSDSQLPADLGIESAISKLYESPQKMTDARSTQSLQKQNALKLVITHIKLALGSESIPTDFVQKLRSCAHGFAEGKAEPALRQTIQSSRHHSVAKRDEQQKTLKSLLASCLHATSFSELADEARGFLQNVYHHFTILEIGRAFSDLGQDEQTFSVDNGEGPLVIDHRVIVEVIVECLSSDRVEVRESAEQAILSIRDAAETIFGSRDSVIKLPIFRQLLTACCHNCYEEEWFSKAGGARGVNILATKLGMGCSWLADKQEDIAHALMYAAKDLPDDLPQATRVQALETLNLILRECNAGVVLEDAMKPHSSLHQLCSFLVLELAHTSRHVRAAAQESLGALAEITGAQVHELVSPVKDQFLAHVFRKPLRALPFAVQVGYIEAVAFCLKLQHDLLVPSDDMARFLRDAILLSEQDNDTVPGRTPDQRHLENVTRLKVSCLHLLSLALDFPDFGQSPTSKSRPKIIQVFFKCLYSRHPTVVNAANDALKTVVDRDSKLPKDILQAGLRPILVSLQDINRLKVDSLNCLARLLQILKSYFKVEIGARLLDNIKHIALPEVLQRASFTLVEQHEKIIVITAVLNIFHLLPPAASTFMESLIEKVMDLERSLRRTHSSPFREPLIKYLNRYPSEAWERFSKRMMTSQQNGRLFAQLLADPESGPLRDAVVQNPKPLAEALGAEGADGDKVFIIMNVIHIIDSVCSHSSSSVSKLVDEKLRDALVEHGKTLERRLKENTIESDLRFAAEQTGTRLTSILSTCLSNDSDNLDFLIEIINLVTSKQLKETPALFQCIYEHIITSQDTGRLKTVLSRSLDIFTDAKLSELMKAFVARNLVMPIIAQDVTRNWDALFQPGNKGTEVVNKTLIEGFQVRLWRPQAAIDPADDSSPPNVDLFRMEMLQMTAILMKYYSNVVQEARKDVIKFSWTYIRLEDLVNKYAAYVILAYFVAFFETPTKIVSQIYGQLVAAHTPEAKVLVAQALEILAPVLPQRMADKDSKTPLWAMLARKPIASDPSNLQQTQAVLHFVARHSDLFYDARDMFAQIIISSIHKVAQLPSLSMDNKKTALGLINVLWSWEQKHAAESRSAHSSPGGTKRKADGTEIRADRSGGSFIQSTSLRLMLIKYLAQFIAFLPDRYPMPSAKNHNLSQNLSAHAAQAADVARRSLELFSNLISEPYWSDLDIGTMFPKVTEPILAGDPKPEDKPEMVITRIVNALNLVSVMVNNKPDEWVSARLPQLQKLLEKPIRNLNPEVQDCLFATDVADNLNRKPLVQRILEVVPKDTSDEENPEAEAPTVEFVTFLSTVATETLSGSNMPAGVNILGAFAACRPHEIDQHLQIAMKILGNYVKDHLNLATQAAQSAMAQGSRPGEAPNPQPPDPILMEAQEKMILKIIDVLAVRVVQLGDNRRPYLTYLTQLIEKSPKLSICSRIVDLISGWVLDVDQTLPTLKEKNAVVLKMMAFEHRSDRTLFDKFLDIVIRIYEDPKITRSELAVRLEPAFLVGTRAPNLELRGRFMSLFDRHLSRTASKRLIYLLCSQNWEPICDGFWLNQAIQLLLGSVEKDTTASLAPDDFRTLSLSMSIGSSRTTGVMLDDGYENFMAEHARFVDQLGEVKISDVLDPLCFLQHGDAELAKNMWSSLFPIFWSILAKEEQSELKKDTIALLTRDWHARQIDKRPNCIQALLEGIARATNPRMLVPQHLLKFLARTYDAWYVATTYMEQTAVDPIVDTPAARESNLDALATVYADLQEDDLFYGLWRRRSQFLLTNTALSYEQVGNWEKAQRTLEQATFKARTGEMPFSQGEYMLWEDHWVVCAQKLQQWDILSDFAKVDNLNDLYLDSVWRHFEKWQAPDQLKQLDAIVKSVADAPTPRRMFFLAFMTLLKLHMGQEPPKVFQRVCDEATQLSIRKWHQLPKRITNAHIPILQSFQQLVEMHDASVICNSLSSTTQTDLDHKAPELKLLLGTWRDRLPNFWDDINAWQDLVTWRRHVFQLVNEKYLSLIPQQQSNASGNSYAYRGYHETAWTINKFAHVARKHQLPEVCINQLSTIYTLPNIEIQEAFLKLREQAKCHYQNPAELQVGLDVINNTNLNYFGPQQKAEFYTLKGMFLAKQSQMAEANDAFGTALFFDLKLPKAWAEWARYNEQLFKEDPSNIAKGVEAVSCYLEAAGTYKNAKSRKALSRVLWLLSLDNSEGKIAQAFEDYKGDTPVWYWITFIPQLLVSIARPEAKILRTILMKIAKHYPQALFFHLRTSREDYQQIRKQHELKTTKAAGGGQGSPNAQGSRPTTAEGRPSTAPRPESANGEKPAGDAKSPTAEPKSEDAKNEDAKSEDKKGTASSPTAEEKTSQQAQTPAQPRPNHPWEVIDEVMTSLKSTFPLLALSLETMTMEIVHYCKSNSDEEAYRLINALFNDALGYVSRSPKYYSAGSKLPASTESNITRFAESMLQEPIRSVFEADFVTNRPEIPEYIAKLRKWRDRFEEKLDRRTSHYNLEACGAILSEFKFFKFDEVEVPGQYLLHKDKNQDFVRIERILPTIELVRSSGVCYRKLRFRGHDGTVHSFLVQHPTPRTCRREERMMQMFRFFNDVLAKRKESRRRKIQFTLPIMVPLTPAVRIVQDDSSYITLQGIYEDYCRKKGFLRDEPILYAVNKLRELHPATQETVQAVRQQVYEATQSKLVPNTIVLDYFKSTFPAFADFWLFRRQASYQLAALSFMTYVMFMKDRHPARMSFSRAFGSIWGSEMVPSMSPQRAVFSNTEPVQFRFTPNLQMLLGPIAIEGIFSASILVIATSLAAPYPQDAQAAGPIANGNTGVQNVHATKTADGKLEQTLSIFVRDEVHYWYTQNHKPPMAPAQMREIVDGNSELIVKRAIALGKPPGSNTGLPANQTVVDQISKCVNPVKLCQMDCLWMPYL